MADNSRERSGTLYVVATPLGNLEDMTFRAVRVLSECAAIAAEDTRRTQKLLNHYQIKVRLVSYREQNHRQAAPSLLSRLEKGENIALATDAGTPVVSDPGAMLAAEAIRRGIPVIPIPGPSAVAAALSVSGLPAGAYVFAGFAPSRRKARRDCLLAMKSERRTLVFFESPHRILDFLEDVMECLGDRRLALCREMTKMNEEYLRGAASEVRRILTGRIEAVRGEITVAVAGAEIESREPWTPEQIADFVRNDRRPVKEIVADLAEATGQSRRELYRLVLNAAGRRREED